MPDPVQNALAAQPSNNLAYIGPTPRNRFMGGIADLLAMGYRLPNMPRMGVPGLDFVAANRNKLLDMLNVGDVQKTAETMSYGGRLGTGAGMTYRPLPETLGAAMAVAPFAGKAIRATEGLPVGASIKLIGEASAPRQTIENIYHGTTPQAAKAIEKSGFDLTKSADGTVWFTSNPNIGEVAASGKGGLVKRSIDTSKMKLGGWDETDKYSTDELINMGFDGLKLTDNGETTYQIFNVDKLSKPLQDAVRQSSGSVYPQQAAFDPFRATAATAAAMGVAAPDLLAAPLSVADQIDNINEVLKKKRKK